MHLRASSRLNSVPDFAIPFFMIFVLGKKKELKLISETPNENAVRPDAMPVPSDDVRMHLWAGSGVGSLAGFTTHVFMSFVLGGKMEKDWIGNPKLKTLYAQTRYRHPLAPSRMHLVVGLRVGSLADVSIRFCMGFVFVKINGNILSGKI